MPIMATIAGIAAPAEVEGAEQGLDLVACRAGAASDPGDGAETAIRPSAARPPTSRALEPEAEEAALELARDEGVVGADEVQHLDDVAVAGHGAARREGDRKPGRDEDEQHEADADADEVFAMVERRREPEAVIVEARGRHLAAQAAPQGSARSACAGPRA